MNRIDVNLPNADTLTELLFEVRPDLIYVSAVSVSTPTQDDQPNWMKVRWLIICKNKKNEFEVIEWNPTKHLAQPSKETEINWV